MLSPEEYHNETKHFYNRFARSPGRMEWETQPNPFRNYGDIPRIDLPFIDSPIQHSATSLFTGIDSPEPVTLQSIAALLELSLGLSCWKEVSGSRWALRMNPSSGNLHPTESYLILPNFDTVSAGIYHYSPFNHQLEQRMTFQNSAPSQGFYIALTSIFWRESWKYGERAFRYSNHDAGHAAAAIRVAANLLGWSVRICESGDEEISTLLGLDRTDWHPEEAEHPDMLLWIGTEQHISTLPSQILTEAQSAPFAGQPNKLSPNHRFWERITSVAQSTPRSGTVTAPTWIKRTLSLSNYDSTGEEIIRQRRSAVDCAISRSHIGFSDFADIAALLLPRESAAPFDLALGESRIHPVFFVHNVENLEQGLYILVRNCNHLEELKATLQQSFSWESTEIPYLYLLEKGNFRDEAMQLSCGQEICGNGAFAVAMLGRFHDEITEDPGRYRELFWESGMIGQVLYLTAEMIGMRGTGIGCYFDDPVHRILGIEESSYQSIYHFTVGFPIIDERIDSRDPYFHLPESRK